MIKRLCTLALILIFSPLGYADTIVRYTISDSSSNQVDKRSAYVSNGKVRVINTAGRVEPEAIFNSQSGELILLDHQQKSFIRVNEKELTAMAQQVKGLLDSVMSEFNFDNPLSSDSEQKAVVHSGIQKRVAGISCELYEIQLNDSKASEVCIAQANRLEMSQSDYQTLENLYKTGDRLAKTARETIGQSLGPIPEFGAGDLGGLPVYIHSTSNNVELELTLTDISSELVSADYFEIPAGYTQQKLPALL